ncbi:D-alanyl-lipoteichoic acid biosynthesis protein DltD [Clostridium saccharoperbutylacetonicum]|uniref:D-alanyl-lipoteichoic acid biosynthesis protein DltD n=1 Tax=Clostridium saccharoperbutylacetonicum TaxID=36745 RepID=UPI0039EAB2A6
MYNVIVFGTGSTANLLLNSLEVGINVICYCDNDKSKWGKKCNGKEIISPFRIKEMEFDYILIASQFNESIYNQLLGLEVNEEQIFEFFRYIECVYNYIDHDLYYIRENAKEIQAIVTGISYAEKAIKAEVLIKRTNKLTRPSQDLYFDYNLIKYIVENNKDYNLKLRYVLICLSYYSFQYDMSYSEMKGKVYLYYESIGKKHHLNYEDNLFKRIGINKMIAEKTLIKHSNGTPVVNWLDNENNNSDIVNERIGERQALIDGNKNYPETVKENTQIFKDYLNLLKDNNIKPIVIVCPVSKYYSKYFPERLKHEFHTIINEVRKEYDFQFFDYFSSELFNDEDFSDVSHLNDKGSEKFTQILNEVIEW